MRFKLVPWVLLALLSACASMPATPDVAVLKRQVEATERAFAKTMADRDLAAFKRFLSQETVFFSGPTPLRGPDAVAAWWQRYYEKPQAPFSWEPKQVEVLDSGTLALSTGPVHDPQGKLIGTFTSVWRLEAPGVWRIVLDKGDQACDCKAR
jgi:ketosteroid isomerase-like protein